MVALSLAAGIGRECDPALFQTGTPAAPVALLVGLTTGAALDGTVVSANVINLQGGEVVSHQWQQDTGGGWVDIAGQTGSDITIDISSGMVADLATLRCAVNVDGVSLATPGAPLRYAAPALTGTVPDQDWMQGAAITPLDLSAFVTGGGLNYTVTTGPLPAGTALSGSTLSGAPAEIVTDRTLVVTATNSGGSVTLSWSVTVVELAVTEMGDGTAEIMVAPSGDITFTISGNTLYDGVYTQDTDGLALSMTALQSGPQCLMAPALAGDGSPASGETLAIIPGLWIHDTDAAPLAISYATNGANSVDVGNPAAPALLIDPADAGADLTVTETATDANGARAAVSNAVTTAAGGALTLSFLDRGTTGVVNNSTGAISGLTTTDGAHHVVILYYHEDVTGILSGVTLGGVNCTLFNDGANDAYGNISRRRFRIYKTDAPVSGTSNTLQFGTNVYFSNFEAFTFALSADATIHDMIINTSAGQDPVQLDVETPDGGALLVAGIQNGVPTSLTPTGCSLASTVGDLFPGENGLSVVVANASNTAAETPRNVQIDTTGVSAQIAYVSMALGVA